MSLPRLILVADRFSDPEVALRTLEAVRFGVRWVQLRDHSASTDVFEYAAVEVSSRILTEYPDVIVSINARLSVSESLSLPFHTGLHGPTVYEALELLGRDRMVGKSIHTLEEAVEARRDEADYVTFGSVYRTKSHPGREGAGMEQLKQVCELSAHMPVIAIGGVSPERVGECLEAGAHGVAVHSAILEATDVFEAVMAYSNELPGL